ncbi:MAG TPA: hypothetical protein VIX80_02020, partial [Candidatus Kapabacteria bacterium]
MKRTTLILALLLFSSGLAYGQAGYLDKTFGDGGVVTTIPFDTAYIEPQDIHILPNGKILHAGLIWSEGTSLNVVGIYVTRHHPNGRIDSSFGKNGLTVFDFGGYDNSARLYCYPDGRMLVYGLAEAYRYNYLEAIPYIIRFLADGRVDSTFGKNGTYFPQGSEEIATYHTLKVDTDGAIFALGTMPKKVSSKMIDYPIITRITSLGKRDPSFGDNGIKIAGSKEDTGGVWDVVLYGKDKCIFSIPSLGSANAPLKMICTDLNGMIDSSFGVNGRIAMQLSDGFESVHGILIDPDEKVLCTAIVNTSSGEYRSILLRFLPTGELDNSFGEFGVSLTPIDVDKYRIVYCTAMDSNKNIIQLALKKDVDSNYFSAVIHYLPNGQLDSSLGVNGISNEVGKHMDGIYSATADPDGKFVLIGVRKGPGNIHSVVICRLNNTGKVQAVSAAKNFALLMI